MTFVAFRHRIHLFEDSSTTFICMKYTKSTDFSILCDIVSTYSIVFVILFRVLKKSNTLHLPADHGVTCSWQRRVCYPHPIRLYPIVGVPRCDPSGAPGCRPPPDVAVRRRICPIPGFAVRGTGPPGYLGATPRAPPGGPAAPGAPPWK